MAAPKSMESLRLCRQLVAVRRRRDLEGVDDARQQREVVRGRGQLDHPLLVVPLPEGVEGRLVDPVRPHELPRVVHDVPLLGRELAGVALRPQDIDDLVAQPVAAGRPHPRGPHARPPPPAASFGLCRSMLNGPRTFPKTFNTWSTTAWLSAGTSDFPVTGAMRDMMSSFLEDCVGAITLTSVA